MGLAATLLARLPSLAAHAVGIIVSLILVYRRRDAAAWLALIGFGLLLAMNGGSWLMGALPIWLLTGGAYALGRLFGLLNILFSLGVAAGALCLAAALWIGLNNRES